MLVQTNDHGWRNGPAHRCERDRLSLNRIRGLKEGQDLLYQKGAHPQD